MKISRPNAGYTREQWRQLHGIDPDGRFPRGGPRPCPAAPRDETTILTELRTQLESMWKRFPAEMRPLGTEDTGQFRAFVDQHFGSVK